MLYYQSPAYLVLDFNVEKLPERKKGGLAWSSGLASLAACPCGEPWPPQGGVRLLPPVLVDARCREEGRTPHRETACKEQD